MLAELLKNLERLSETQRPKNEFRCSGLPFCPVRWLAQELDPEPFKATFGFDYYTSVGTTMHKIFQKWLARTSGLFGNWECHKCKTKETLKWSPVHCPTCNKFMEYEEVEIVEPTTGLTGHVDGITRCEVGSDDLLVFDWKSIGIRGLKDDELPYSYNVQQINSYGVLLRRLFDLPIKEIGLVYVARDNPTNFKIWRSANIIDEELDIHLKRWLKMQKMFKSNNYTGLQKIRLCRGDSDENMKRCRLRSICSDPNNIVSFIEGLGT